MSTITIKGHIHAKPARRLFSEPAHTFAGMELSFWTFEDMKDQGYVYVCPHELTFEIPEGWDPRPGQIAALEAKKEALQKEFSRAVMVINDQISRLQAIAYEPDDKAPAPEFFADEGQPL